MERKEGEVEREHVSEGVQEQRVVSVGPAVPAESEVVSMFNPSWRPVQLVYLVFGIIEGLLLIRLVLKLLGANPHAAFASWDYNVTNVFMGPFKNLLATIGNEQSQLEISVVVAVLVYMLIAWAVARLVTIVFYRDITIARRSRGLRPRGD